MSPAQIVLTVNASFAIEKGDNKGNSLEALFDIERGRNIARTTSNDNGEFRLEFDPSAELRLELFIDRRYPVHLPVVVAQAQAIESAGKKPKTSAGVGEYSMVAPT